MGKPSQYPPGPVTTQVEKGREQMRKLTKPFFRQISQPKWLKVAEAVLGDRVLHSTHITGFSKGELRDPGPKGFLALGLVNEAIALGKVPASLMPKEGLKPMVDPTGRPLGPTDLFAVFTGLLDLGLEDLREIPAESEAKVAKDLGRWLRVSLAAKGIDWSCTDERRFRELHPAVEKLLWNGTPYGDEVVEAIPLMAKELGIGEGEVWDVITASINGEPLPQ
jgi:hypothetical protein